MTDVQTRNDLLAALRDDAVRLPQVVAAIGADDLERGVYENGWSARQLLAHLAAIEWTYPRLIEQARSPAEARPTSSASGSFDMDAYNHRQVSNRADATIPELLEEFARNRQSTISAIAEAEAAAAKSTHPLRRRRPGHAPRSPNQRDGRARAHTPQRPGIRRRHRRIIGVAHWRRYLGVVQLNTYEAISPS